jgi:UDP-GlcNAc3NAcA epimerase
MLYALKQATLVVTDSGGLQKEAFFSKKPCVTLRNETEWVELVEIGVNRLFTSLDTDLPATIVSALAHSNDYSFDGYGNGDAAVRIAQTLLQLR